MNKITMGFISAVSILFLGQGVFAADAWDAPAFSADTGVMLREAKAVTTGPDAIVVTLLEENRYEFAPDGREKHTLHVVIRIVDGHGAEDWSTVEARWEPWHQSRPLIRARVITPDGRVHTLDPRTIAEAPVAQDSPEYFSDARTLEGPLPAVEAGAVIEEEIVVEDTAPAYQAGNFRRIGFGYGKAYPARKIRLILDAPSSLPLHYLARNLPDMRPVREEKDDRVRFTFEAGPVADIPDFEYNLPHDVPISPQVVFSTGKSWAEVASSYNAIVDGQIRGADLKRFLQPDPLKGNTRENAAELLARLRKEVRYVAVEFGDAAIVPHTPAEVLQRRFGDCKDQAALLVALLRASDIPAYVALVNVDNRADPEADLPGFGQFDHAIVHVAADKPFWIDPTDPDLDAGDIRSEAQGRLALVAAPGTTQLTRIPETSSSDNRQIEVREFYLAEAGEARAVETTQAWGTRALAFRSLGRSESDKLKNNLSDYAQRIYLTSDITRAETTHKKFDLPAGLVIEVPKTKRGETATADAAVYVRLESVFDELPGYFWSKGKSEKQPRKPRTRELLLPEAYTREIRYRVFPPLGYVARELPKAETKTWGRATFSQEYHVEKDGTVTAALSFDTGPRRMSASDAEALRKGVLETADSDAVTLAFEQKGVTLLNGGKIREALGEFRSLEKAHPKEALHHGQIADAMLEAGLGDAARVEGRRAVELEPQSAAAHLKLGWVLEHDSLGRLFKKDFDYDGALAEFRQAVKLEPENTQAHESLAIVLEHNKQGIRYGRGSRLAEAIAEYKVVAKEIKDTDMAWNPVFDMLWSNKYDDARQAAEQLSHSPTRNYLLLTSIAATDPPAAIREADSRIHDNAERQAALSGAGQFLMKLRLYSAAGKILAASAQGASNAAAVLASANQIGKLQRHEDSRPDADDPRTVVREFFTLLITCDSDSLISELSKISSRHARVHLVQKEEEDEARHTAQEVRGRLGRLGLPSDVLIDLVLGNLPMDVESDKATGFRVRMPNPAKPGSTMSMFVVWEEGRFRFLDVADSGAAVSREILECSERGDLDGARHWLDWVREESEMGGGEDPLSGPLLPRFWTKGQKGGKDVITDAAAALLAGDRQEPRAVLILRAALEKAAEADRPRYLLALAQAYYRRENYRDLQSVAESLVKIFPESQTSFGLLTAALNAQHLWKESRRAAEDRLRSLPDDPNAIRSLADVAAIEGNYIEGERLLRRLIASGKAKSEDRNSLGWHALFHPPVPSEVTAEVLKGVDQRSSFGLLHTVAMLYAEEGKTTEARDVLRQAMEDAAMEELDSAVWLVVGRMAEDFEAHDAAIAAYNKVEKPKKEYQIPLSSYMMAQQRLAALKTKIP
jgi:tetratricopeptide (TPR) repeat protein/transglutaminase-like putative cysteine protease